MTEALDDKPFLVAKDHEDTSYIVIYGDLTEENSFSYLSQFKTHIIVDVNRVKHINSIGIRDWMDWIEAINEKIYLVECSTDFMAQASVLKDFIRNCIIVSCYVPYFCPECDHETQHLLETSQAIQIVPFAPLPYTCEECGETMEVDAIEEAYFAYLHRIQPEDLDLKILQKIKQFPPI